MNVYRCSTCRRCFGIASSLLDHQSLWSTLHRHDPDVNEHDGQPWTIETLRPGDWFDYDGHRVEFVSQDPEGFIYQRGRDCMIGSFDEICIPSVDTQLVLAWAAADDLGLEADEVSAWWYSHHLTLRWHHDPGRLAEERHMMLVAIGLAQLGKAAKS